MVEYCFGKYYFVDLSCLQKHFDLNLVEVHSYFDFEVSDLIRWLSHYYLKKMELEHFKVVKEISFFVVVYFIDFFEHLFVFEHLLMWH